jgi:hypothetical protein
VETLGFLELNLLEFREKLIKLECFQVYLGLEFGRQSVKTQDFLVLNVFTNLRKFFPNGTQIRENLSSNLC